jgi:hypothetical protein
MALDTDRVITRYSLTQIPPPHLVLVKVDSWAANQPSLLTFCDRKGRTIGDSDHLTGVYRAEQITQVSDLIPNDATTPPLHPLPMNEEAHLSEAEIQETQITDPLTAPTPILTPNSGLENYTDPTIFHPTIEHPPLTTTEYEPESTIEYPSFSPNPDEITGVPSLEPTEDSAEAAGVRRFSRVKTAPTSYTPGFDGKAYSFHLQLLHPDTHLSFLTHEVFATPTDPQVLATLATTMTQLSLKTGLKAWGDKASQAVHSEMKQLHFRDTSLPKHWKDLNETERKTILDSHMFLKEKRDGKIKAKRLHVQGRCQLSHCCHRSCHTHM